MEFVKSEANSTPKAVEKLKYGNVRVNRNIAAEERDGQTVYTYETAIMTETQYAAYLGAQEVALKREQEIQDETVLALIEEGSL